MDRPRERSLVETARLGARRTQAGILEVQQKKGDTDMWQLYVREGPFPGVPAVVISDERGAVQWQGASVLDALERLVKAGQETVAIEVVPAAAFVAAVEATFGKLPTPPPQHHYERR